MEYEFSLLKDITKNSYHNRNDLLLFHRSRGVEGHPLKEGERRPRQVTSTKAPCDTQVLLLLQIRVVHSMPGIVS